ncbi:hypothetical protein [Halobacillus litoralis]|uniref:hypothetical protein n=1 Tax=Halobacillus litoralis TaxID=45668 RepID=UPI001CD195D1|nr:hypothetical protein [Halobacillus litoralis]MCA1021568.1 hypothetical protein [Halobacillus litoralis]
MLQRITINKKRSDGARLEVKIDLTDGKFRVKDVGVKVGRQRKFRYVEDSVRNDYSYRRLDMKKRKDYMLKEILKECPVELLNESLEEAWMSIKPDPIEIS